MQKDKSFTLRDLVLLGTMNAVLIVLLYVIILILHLIPPLWGFMDPISSLLLAPVYILMLRLVPKMFVMTIHGAILGLFSILTGWWPGLLAGIAAGLLADFSSKLYGGYSNPGALYLSIPVFATVKTLLFYFPLYSFVFLPVFEDVVSAWPKEAVEGYTVIFAGLILLLNLAACLTGLKLGKKMLSRHFVRAGVVEI